MTIREISAQDFSNLMRSGARPFVLDVRTGIECRTRALDTACVHIPLHLLDAARFMQEHGQALAGGPVYILCRSGGRAYKAAEALERAGAQAIVIQGGLEGCAACDTPVRTGKVLSLERQVRIAAGSLVLLGVLLGHFVNDGFYILSGLVGGGLVFAGVTDRCGLALLLARAPWNRDGTENAIQKSIRQFSDKGGI